MNSKKNPAQAGFFYTIDSGHQGGYFSRMKEVVKYPNCFVCGDKNQHGLQAVFYFDGEKAFTVVTADEMFEGYRGIYHGGVISSLLDEVMIKAILAMDLFVVTAEMTVKYHKPVTVGTSLTITGRLIKQKGRLCYTKGEVCDDSGVVYASATGKYIEAKDSLKKKLLTSVE